MFKSTSVSPLGTTMRNRASKSLTSSSEIGLTSQDNKIFAGFLGRWKIQDLARKVLFDPAFFTPEHLLRYQFSGRGLNMPEASQNMSQEYFAWQKAYSEEFNKLPKQKQFEYQPHRTCHCMNTVISNTDHVPVRKTPGKKIAHYKNLQTCGSPWSCPVCGAKITEHRCGEILKATEIWFSESEQRTILMLTLTIPHNVNQSLKYVLSHFKKARRKMREQKPLKKQPLFQPWKQITEQYLVAGSINSKECTVGSNGWHVHSHELLFIDGLLSDSQIQVMMDLISTAWIKACLDVGLSIPSIEAMQRVSVKLDRATSPADYITKFGLSDYHKYQEILSGGWGSAQEMSKAHVKKSKGGLSPFDLLRVIIDGGSYKKYGQMFYDFCRAFKGSRLIHFSKGFKDQLGIQSITDQEIVDLEEVPTIELGVLTKKEFMLIRANKQRANVLIIAGLSGWSAVKNFIEGLHYDSKTKTSRKHGSVPGYETKN